MSYISGNFTFNFVDKLIVLSSSITEVTCQQLVNAIRKAEYDFEGIAHPKIADVSGKDDLGGGISVGITLELLDNWRVQFQSRAGPSFEQVTVKDGNLVGRTLK